MEDIHHKRKKHEDELHADFLKTCIEEDIIPKGLMVDLTSTLEDKDNEIFKQQMETNFKKLFTGAYVMPR